LTGFKSNTAEFIKRSRDVHGNVYDYSYVDYVKNSSKVLIKCSVHGDFEQAPMSHLRGSGCPKCGRLRTTQSSCKSSANWLHDFINRHGDRFDYSNMDNILEVALSNFLFDRIKCK